MSKKMGIYMTLIAAVIAALGYIIVALINRSAAIEAIQKPIESTQTAEARLTGIAVTTQASSSQITNTPAPSFTPSLAPIEATQTATALSGTPTEPLQQYVALQTMEVDVVSYSGQTDATLGDSTAFLSIVRGDNDVIQYWLDYEISLSGDPGTAGLEFKFQNLQSLVAYKSINFTIDFVSPDIRVGFYIENEGENGRGDAVTLSRDMDIENVSVIHLENEKYRFRIPLERFTDTNMSNVREFGIYVNNDLLLGKGKIMIENILFEGR